MGVALAALELVAALPPSCAAPASRDVELVADEVDVLVAVELDVVVPPPLFPASSSVEPVVAEVAVLVAVGLEVAVLALPVERPVELSPVVELAADEADAELSAPPCESVVEVSAPPQASAAEPIALKNNGRDETFMSAWSTHSTISLSCDLRSLEDADSSVPKTACLGPKRRRSPQERIRHCNIQ